MNGSSHIHCRIGFYLNFFGLNCRDRVSKSAYRSSRTAFGMPHSTAQFPAQKASESEE